MIATLTRPIGRLIRAGLILQGICGCSRLFPAATTFPTRYSLDRPQWAATPAAAAAPTLIVNPTRAVPGFDSSHIVYVREAYQLEYFAYSEWVDPPARLLMPLLVGALEHSGAFRAVMATPGTAVGDLRLDTEIVRLQHEFTTQPSRVRFTLRAYLIDETTRHILAWNEFEAIVPATSDDPQAGVVAANRAVGKVLERLAAFCANGRH